MKRLLLLIFACCVASLQSACSDPGSCLDVLDGPGAPSIEFTSVPALGSVGSVQGQVSHVAPASYIVAVFIQVNGGWWLKPYFSAPNTVISCGGGFSADVTTGGNDQNATEIVALLLPSGTTVPLLAGQTTLPQSLYQTAVAETSVNR